MKHLLIHHMLITRPYQTILKSQSSMQWSQLCKSPAFWKQKPVYPRPGPHVIKSFYLCNLAPVDHILILQGPHTGLGILFNPSEVFDEGLKNRELFYSR